MDTYKVLYSKDTAHFHLITRDENGFNFVGFLETGYNPKVPPELTSTKQWEQAINLSMICSSKYKLLVAFSSQLSRVPQYYHLVSFEDLEMFQNILLQMSKMQ